MTRPLSTDALIARLADAPAPAPLRASRAAMGMAATTGVGILAGMMLFGLTLRPAPLAAMAEPVVLAKTVLPLVAAGGAFRAALRAARPGTAPRAWLVGIPALVAVALWAASVRATPVPDLLPAIAGSSATACLLAVMSLFYVTWYGLAMVLSAAVGAMAGHRHLRW